MLFSLNCEADPKNCCEDRNRVIVREASGLHTSTDIIFQILRSEPKPDVIAHHKSLKNCLNSSCFNIFHLIS